MFIINILKLDNNYIIWYSYYYGSNDVKETCHTEYQPVMSQFIESKASTLKSLNLTI